jgi:hypothetical protein
VEAVGTMGSATKRLSTQDLDPWSGCARLAERLVSGHLHFLLVG